jgi:uncharacterized protein (TIGR02596 family)
MQAPELPSHSFKKRQAFSLLELLVVIGIIALVATMAVSALSSMQRAQSLASAAQNFASQISFARQTATARNLPVEVRIYQLPEFGSRSGAPLYWRAIGVFEGSGTNAGALSRPYAFSERVVLETEPSVSPLWASMAQGTGAFPGYGTTEWPYRSLTIRPNLRVSTGGTQPADTAWALTLRQENDPAESGSLPANFATIQINPFTARVNILRP